MKRYISNLLTALTGKDPYRQELEEVRAEFEQTTQQVGQLEHLCDSLHLKLQKSDNMLKDYQRLVENLRERIAEKDAMLDRMMVG